MDGVAEGSAQDALVSEAKAAEVVRLDFEAEALASLREREFGELVARQGRFLYRVALGLLRHPEDAEDAVQETLLKLYCGEAWRGMENERAFLARTVWRMGLNRIAGRTAMEDVTAMQIPSGGDSPEQEAVDEDERGLLRELIDALPEELRQTLVLSAIEGMTSRQVAETMGIPEGTVRTRLMRARSELKRRYESLRQGKGVRR
jgi:RNA polymerase sigma-70 factor (ECF subfamily)